MKREEFLQSIKDSLETAGFLVDDLVQFCVEEEAKKKKTEVSD